MAFRTHLYATNTFHLHSVGGVECCKGLSAVWYMWCGCTVSQTIIIDQSLSIFVGNNNISIKVIILVSIDRDFVVVLGGLCHHLSTWLNCLTSLALGIVGIVMILLTTCMFLTSVPLSLISLHSLRLTLGQRPSWMYCSSYHCLIAIVGTLDGLFYCAYWVAYYLLTDSLLIADWWLTVLLPLLVTDLTCMTRVLYWPLRGLSYK